MLQRHNARRAKKNPDGSPAGGGIAGMGSPGSGHGGMGGGGLPLPGSIAAQQQQAANLAAFTAMQAAGMGEEFLRSMLQPMM